MTLSAPDPIGSKLCSAKGCRTEAAYGLLWNNPKLHAPERLKSWLTCEEHRVSLSYFLSVRGFLKDTVPVSRLSASQDPDEVG